MAKVIKEVQMLGKDIYERPVGVTCTLHELIEAAEESNVDFADGQFLLGDCEYEVFVNGKAVDGDKVKLVLMDTEEGKQDTFINEATGGEIDASSIREAQALLKLTKEELVARLLNASY